MSGIAKEIEIFSDITFVGRPLGATTKGIIIEVVASFLELVAEAIVGIFEIKSEMRPSARCTSKRPSQTYTSSSLFWNACNLRALATSLNGLVCSKMPLVFAPPDLFLGRVVSNPKNDMAESGTVAVVQN